jgi:class 3 adenylate cyclase
MRTSLLDFPTNALRLTTGLAVSLRGTRGTTPRSGSSGRRADPYVQSRRGTVAFVFTDIEGGTKRWERDSAVMWGDQHPCGEAVCA